MKTRDELNAYYRERTANQTPEQRARKAAYARERRRLNPWTPEQRERHYEANRRYIASHSSPEEIEARRAYSRNRQRAIRQAPDYVYDSAKKREWLLRRRFGITTEQYDALLAAQGGVCAICKRAETKSHPKTGLVGALAIDHDHSCCPGRSQSCGKCVRGLLCSSCNLALGKFNDDPRLLKAALAYLG